MRVAWVGMTIVLMPVAAMARTDIVATCYQTCADSTHANPGYKACVARATDKADELLNDSYKKLQDAVRADAKDMGQSPEVQLGYLKDAQKQWIAYRDASCTFDDSLAFGGALIGSNFRHVPALSPTSASMTSSASRRRSWVSPERRFRPAKALETAEKARILSPNS